MRKLALVLLSAPVLAAGASAQSAEPDAPCRAPVSLDDKKCSDALRAGASADREGELVQRDDGYYVFVPRRKE